MQNEGDVVLLVEDNEDDQLLTMRAFRKAGIANPITVANDGAEALDYFFGEGAEQRPTPRIVLLDLNLPRVSGLDVLERLRAHPRTKVVPVVVLTSSKEEEDVVRSYALGANSYVRKPVDFAEFAEAAKHLGLYWLLVNHPVTAEPTR